jgi:hypothetical protein
MFFSFAARAADLARLTHDGSSGPEDSAMQSKSKAGHFGVTETFALLARVCGQLGVPSLAVPLRIIEENPAKVPLDCMVIEEN